MIRRHQFLLLLVLFTGASVWAVAQPTAEEEALQRRTLEALRKHPEHLVKLRENWKAFNAMSGSRKNAVVKLDQDLEKTTGKNKERLWNALTRYADWLEDLRKSDFLAYQAIQAAPNGDARLALIRERRLQQNQWIIAKRFWSELESKQPMPCRLADFATKEKGKGGTEVNKVKDYVTDYLLPYITNEQKKQLADAEGRWPEYPQTLVEIARPRPSALPPRLEEDLPRKFAKLPVPVQHRFEKKGVKSKVKEIKQHEGPTFASNVVDLAFRENIGPFDYEFWACSHKWLLPPMKEFVDTKLMPALDHNEKQKLAEVSGKWPGYPLAIKNFSKKHALQPPWHFLPESDRWKWDLYRSPRATSWEPKAAKEKDAPRPAPQLEKERAVPPGNQINE